MKIPPTCTTVYTPTATVTNFNLLPSHYTDSCDIDGEVYEHGESLDGGDPVCGWYVHVHVIYFYYKSTCTCTYREKFVKHFIWVLIGIF